MRHLNYLMYLSFITFVIAALFAGFSDILSYDEKYVLWRFLGLALLLIITLIFINTTVRLVTKRKSRGEAGWEASANDKKNGGQHDGSDIRPVLIRTLTEMGCQPKENDGDIYFIYQGEGFAISTNRNSNIIWIYDAAWGAMSMDDPDAEALKQAVNKANELCATVNAWTIDEEKGQIELQCHMTAYLDERIPDLKGYLGSILDCFFIAHRGVEKEFEDLKRNKEVS